MPQPRGGLKVAVLPIHLPRSLTREIVSLMDREADLLNRLAWLPVMGCRGTKARLPCRLCASAGPTVLAHPSPLPGPDCRGREPSLMAGLRTRLANQFLEFVRCEQAASAAAAHHRLPGRHGAAVQTC